MSQFCNTCHFIMTVQIDQDTYQLKCVQPKNLQSQNLEPCKNNIKDITSPIVFTNQDSNKITFQDSFVQTNDFVTQQCELKCEFCNSYLYVHYQKDNDDVIYYCKCQQNLQQFENEEQDVQLTPKQMKQAFLDSFIQQ